jgi:hypothetical protein
MVFLTKSIHHTCADIDSKVLGQKLTILPEGSIRMVFSYFESYFLMLRQNTLLPTTTLLRFYIPGHSLLFQEALAGVRTD